MKFNFNEKLRDIWKVMTIEAKGVYKEDKWRKWRQLEHR